MDPPNTPRAKLLSGYFADQISSDALDILYSSVVTELKAWSACSLFVETPGSFRPDVERQLTPEIVKK